MKKFILILLFITLSPSISYAAGTTATVHVSGLVCDFCARSIEKVFGKQESISKVKVDLNEKIIALDFKDKQNLDDEMITKLVTDSGYKVISINRGKDVK